MINKKAIAAAGVAVLALGTLTAVAQKPAANMGFFVTSANPKGGNLGGLAGGDALCQSLAQAAGAGGKTWHAYLSTSTVDEIMYASTTHTSSSRVVPNARSSSGSAMISVPEFVATSNMPRLVHDSAHHL